MFLQRVHVVTLNFSMLQLCVSLDSNFKKNLVRFRQKKQLVRVCKNIMFWLKISGFVLYDIYKFYRIHGLQKLFNNVNIH